MKYMFFPGCKIPYHLPGYGASTRAVLAALDIELVDAEFNCCGYPIRHRSFEAAVFSAARALAITRQAGLPLLTPCMCCYGNLMHADHWMRKHPPLERSVNRLLSDEGLEWGDGIDIRHLFSVLYEDVGTDAIRSRIRRPQTHRKVAAHYGCHALRPAKVVRFDNPLAPHRFESLIAAIGAEPVEWSERLSCCGNPVWGKNDRLAIALMEKKLMSAERSGADCLCTGCTYCQLQFGPIRREMVPGSGGIDAILFTRLLGESLGLDPERLGAGLPERSPGSDLQNRALNFKDLDSASLNPNNRLSKTT